MSPVAIHTHGWKEAKWSKVPCVRNQRDGRGLNPGPPDPEFEVLTARPHLPSDFFNGRKIKQKENARDSISSLEFYVNINLLYTVFFCFRREGFWYFLCLIANFDLILSLSVREDVSCLSLPCTQLERIEILLQSHKTHAAQAAGKLSFQFSFINFAFLKLKTQDT